MIFTPGVHQELGIHHLVNNPIAGLFAGMGLGKTAITLAALDHKFRDFQIDGVLVVAPKRVITLTWPDEFEKWENFSWMKWADLRTKEGQQALENRTAHVYGINYEMLPRFTKEYFKGRRKLPFNCLVLDELTRVKNHKSTRAKALRYYIGKFDHRIGLTGTPNPNNLLELFAQVRMLDDGKRFGVSFNRFKEDHFYPTDYHKYNWEPNDGTEDWIYEQIKDLCLPLRSEDYSDIQEPYVEEIEIPLPSEARKVYEDMARELYALLKNPTAEIVAANRAVLTNKLLQISGGAIYYEEEGNPQTRKTNILHNGKIKALKKLIKRLREPCMIACNYIHERERILEAFPEAIAWADCENERKLMDDWNAGKVSIIVSDPRSIGHGLNLQYGGRNIIWFSLTWSREYFDQFNARLARPGQEKRVQIFILTCIDTMDEAVYETLKNRLEGQNALLRALDNFRRLREAA